MHNSTGQWESSEHQCDGMLEGAWPHYQNLNNTEALVKHTRNEFNMLFPFKLYIFPFNSHFSMFLNLYTKCVWLYVVTSYVHALSYIILFDSSLSHFVVISSSFHKITRIHTYSRYKHMYILPLCTQQLQVKQNITTMG